MNPVEGTLSRASDHAKRPANSHLNFKRHTECLGTSTERLDSTCVDRVGCRLACDPSGLNSSASTSRAVHTDGQMFLQHFDHATSIQLFMLLKTQAWDSWTTLTLLTLHGGRLFFFFSELNVYLFFSSCWGLKGFFCNCFIYRADNVSPVILNLLNATAMTLTFAISAILHSDKL